MVACVFTKDNGIISGLLKNCVNTKHKPLVGQIGSVIWSARLDSQLGVFHWEAEHNMSAGLLLKPELLKIINSIFALIKVLLPERESYLDLYNKTIKILLNLAHSDEDSLSLYLDWELFLLSELGYSLDLSRCSGCGTVSCLHYLSPKTGRAVCSNCAKPYIDRLYKLPVTLQVSYKFLQDVCRVQGIDVPMARKMLQ